MVKSKAMNVTVQNLPKSTIKLLFTVSPAEIDQTYQKVLADVAKDVELPGFRKGKAPVELVKEKADPQKLANETVKELVTTYYPQAVKEKALNPIITPKIEFDDFERSKDFTFSATTAIRPILTIGDYRAELAKLYAKRIAEQEKTPADNKQAEHVHITPADVIDAIIAVTTVELPDMLVEDEVSKMLSRLVTQVQAVKLTIDDYLKSINKTVDDLRGDYAKSATRTITGEMALGDVAAKENITVDESEVDATIEAAGDPKLKERYAQNPLEKTYIRAIIAKNKLIWKLAEETEAAGKEKDAQ